MEAIQGAGLWHIELVLRDISGLTAERCNCICSKVSKVLSHYQATRDRPPSFDQSLTLCLMVIGYCGAFP